MAVESVSPNEQRWLTCGLDKGMFSDEVAVTYPSTGEWRASVFVPKDMVEGDFGSNGKVQVRIIRRNGKILAVLPNSYQDIVEISESDILK